MEAQDLSEEHGNDRRVGGSAAFKKKEKNGKLERR